PPFFRAFHGFAIDDCEGRCWFLALQFAHCGIECMMDLCKYTGAMQLDKVVMRRAFGWKVLGQLAPLAPGRKYVEYAVDELSVGKCCVRVEEIALSEHTPRQSN